MNLAACLEFFCLQEPPRSDLWPAVSGHIDFNLKPFIPSFKVSPSRPKRPLKMLVLRLGLGHQKHISRKGWEEQKWEKTAASADHAIIQLQCENGLIKSKSLYKRLLG